MDSLKEKLKKKIEDAETAEEAQVWANTLRTVCLAEKSN